MFVFSNFPIKLLGEFGAHAVTIAHPIFPESISLSTKLLSVSIKKRNLIITFVATSFEIRSLMWKC